MGSPVQVSVCMHVARETNCELEIHAQLQNYGLFETRGTWWTSLHICSVAVGEYRHDRGLIHLVKGLTSKPGWINGLCHSLLITSIV